MNVHWPTRRASLDYGGSEPTVFVATTYSALPDRVAMYAILAGHRDVMHQLVRGYEATLR